eukprot:GILJ01005863.1.p1 GENE.GILJ01005863.1~~GILJ01005863.1.p1  ORF type:complete len:378 (-),score=34.54 GILJ01005863.1:80-1213(-)
MRPNFFLSRAKMVILKIADLRASAAVHSVETIGEPRELARYSRSEDGLLSFDRRCLRNYVKPEVMGLDLNDGFEDFVDKDRSTDQPAPVQPILESLASENQTLASIKFLSFRNNFNKLMGTLTDPQRGWKMAVFRRDGIIVLDVRETEEKLREEQRRDERMARMSYWGYKFEQICTEPDSTAPVNCNVEYCTIVKTCIGSHRIVLAAEIDCVMPSDGKYVELKTSKVIQSDRDRDIFAKRKMLTFWIQSYLAGVPYIACGFRDDRGIITGVQHFKTTDLPKQAKPFWQPSSCLSPTNQILSFIDNNTTDGNSYILLFNGRADGQIELIPAPSETPSFDIGLLETLHSPQPNPSSSRESRSQDMNQQSIDSAKRTRLT